MGRTINGKPIQEIVEELLKPFQTNDFKLDRNDHYYLPSEKFRQRMNEVIGVMNYDFITSEPQVMVIGTRPQIYLSGSLIIRDDDGNQVVKKSACGGSPIIMINQTKEAAAVKNDMESASQDVFKRCCKAFGIAEAQLKQLRKENPVNDNNTISNENKELLLYRVTLRESFSTLGSNGYCAMVNIEGETEPRKLVLWRIGIQNVEKYIPIKDFVKNYKPGKTFSIYGYKSEFQPKGKQVELQLVMDSPYVVEEESC